MTRRYLAERADGTRCEVRIQAIVGEFGSVGRFIKTVALAALAAHEKKS